MEEELLSRQGRLGETVRVCVYLDFLELWQVLSSYDGDLRDPHWWPQESPVPMRVARGPLGIPLSSLPGSRRAKDKPTPLRPSNKVLDVE